MTARSGARVAVIGGGITGLAAAWELTRAGLSVVVFETSPTLGGKIRTSPLGDLPRVDEGADAFLARVPEAIDLATEVGLGDSLVSPATGSAFVALDGRLHPIPPGLVLGVPAGLTGLARSRLLTWPGKARAALDVVLPRRPIAHDSLGRTIRDRFGDEVLERLVDPLVGSINAGDADHLSLVGATPQIAAVAERSRSLLVGLRRNPPPQPGPVFLTPLDGMGALVERLARALVAAGAEVRPATPVGGLEPGPDGRGHRVDGEVFDAVILTAPAYASAHLLRPTMPGVADDLAAIPYAGVVMVSAVVPGESLAGVPVGSGYLVPKPVQRDVTAVSFASRKWVHWNPLDGSQVLRISLGRYGNERALDLDDEAVVEVALGEVRGHLGLAADLQPSAVRVGRWPAAFPQYLPHHLDRVQAIEAGLRKASPTLVVAGAGGRGIGIPACIRQGRGAAAAITQVLTGPRE